MKYQEMGVKFGYDVKLEDIKNKNDLDKSNQAFENRMKEHKYTQGQANYRANLAAQTRADKIDAPITWTQNGVEDAISENDVVALANEALTDKAEAGGNNELILKMDPEYQYIFKASSGGLNAKEMKQFVQKYYRFIKQKPGCYREMIK